MSKGFRKSVQENFGLIATFIGFIVDSISLVAFTASKIPPSIPYINYKLGAPFQLTLWAVAFVTYVGFLRERWLKISRNPSTRRERTFSQFLYYDLLIGFKYPFDLIPFIFFLLLLLTILAQLTFSEGVILISILGLAFIIVFIGRLQEESSISDISINNEEVFGTWVIRIEKELNSNGFVTNVELKSLYSENLSYCTQALQMYQSEFELEKDLILVKEYLETGWGSSEKSLWLWVVAPRELADSRPWLIDKYKYFDYV
jgi:hypothetical protein